MASVLLIMPTYGHFEYAIEALRSYFKHAPSENFSAIVVDDASPEVSQGLAWSDMVDRIVKELQVTQGQQVIFHRFEEHSGLTRSWNAGLQIAKQFGFDYTICGNSDTLFTPGWHEAPCHLADNGYQLVGPLSNAPGPTNSGKQDVSRYFPNFRVTDNPAVLADVAIYLKARYGVVGCVESNVNGFCLVAKTKTWWDGAFDKENVFDPKHALTFNEDELQRRWFAKGWKSAIALGSYVFHYRAVTRGDKHRHHGSFRRKGA
jgi:GT2 family glycosyltransferase